MALHPILVATDGVDFAIMGKAAERLRQPPLGEGVGRITLVENRDAAFKTVVLKIGVKDRKAFGEEQALVDNRPARQRADVEIANLRGDDLLLNPAADEVEILFKLGRIHRIGHWTRDHDLFDLWPCGLRLGADNRHVDRHLTPAIDGVAGVDDFSLDNRPAVFLCAQVGARQEHHADRQTVWHRAVAAVRNGIVKEADRQVDMQPSAITRLAVGINGTTVPHGFERLNPGCHHAARRLAIGRGNQANAAGIAFGFRIIHALIGEAFMFGGGVEYGHAATFSRRAFDLR